MKQKILIGVEVEYLRDVIQRCSPGCPYYPAADLPGVCQVLGDRLESEEDGFRRSPRCLAAAGNHNILGKCLAGE